MKVYPVVFASLLLTAAPSTFWAQSKPAPALRAGAAKIDVTPAQGELPKNYEGILDHIYSRAIVVDNGITRAALITVDAGAISDQIRQPVIQRMQAELKIPADNILITASHTHSVPFTAAKDLPDKIFESVRLATERLQPARIGYGTGVSYINVNRDYIEPKTRRWWEGPNYEGTSDKTVAVVKFESLNGDPIAVYYNYAMHAVTVGMFDKVSGDAPGAASRYIEDSFDDKIVAVWSTGASGDQNPIFFQQTFDLRDIRVQEYKKRGEDISNSMPGGGQGLDKQNPRVAKLMNQQKEMIGSMGQFLGEEVMHVMRGMDRMDSTAQIHGGQKTITCPGRERTDKGRGGLAGTYKEGSPVEIRLGMVIIDGIAIGAVNGEVYNLIAQRLKRESPYARTMMVTLTNGMARSGYIPDDASFGHYTFEVLSSRLQPGCAETSIVNGLLDLMPPQQF
jgi:hypothetical protein